MSEQEVAPVSLTIKELNEALDALHVLAVGGVKIAHNGLGLDDLPVVVELIKKNQVIIEGVKGIEGALPELKDLDSAEAAQVFAKVMGIIADIKKAAKGEPVEIQ